MTACCCMSIASELLWFITQRPSKTSVLPSERRRCPVMLNDENPMGYEISTVPRGMNAYSFSRSIRMETSRITLIAIRTSYLHHTTFSSRLE
jgi:hypothetical protein